ncbi:Nucleoporin Nup88 [Phytophthora cactorum]|nr:Nucleoporin Nup88 [Phytophthora cactorum]
MTMRAASDDWALRDNLQLCGSVSPPTYADLRTAAHLQTFDVRDGSAALWGDSGKVFLVNVLHQSQAKPPKEQLLQHVTLDPPLQPHEAAEVEQIKLNASGSQVLLLAKSWIKVLRLPADNKHKPQSLQRRADSDSKQRFFVRFEDGSEQEVTLKEDELKDVDSVAEQVKRRVASGKRVAFVSREQSVAAVRAVGYFSNVRHAAWHPLSDTHLVVLSDAEEIEVFNTQQDVSKPEQRHRLDFPTKARATGAFSTCFCFGASIQLQQQQAAQMQAAQIWDAFTCYVLRSDGAVYALCPLVPYDCCASKTFLQILSTEVDAQIAVCKQKVEAVGSGSGLQSRLLELKSQKYWLQEGWAPASTQTRRSSPRFGGRAQTPPGRNDKTNADAFCYLIHTTRGCDPQSVVEGKNQLSGGSSATSLLVVPHASRNSADKRPLILLDAPIRPQWRSNRQAAASSAMRKLPALLLECLNLGIDDSGGKAVLERDIADPRLIYCPHSTGVHVINVSWVFALTSGKKFTELPKSSVRHVSACLRASLGLLQLRRLRFEVVNVSAASSELLKGVLAGSSNTGTENLQKTLPDTLASMASSKSRAPVAATSDNSSDGGIRPFGDIVEEKLEALSARGTRVTGSTLMHEVDDAVLAFVLERVKILYEDVEYIDEMDQLMRDRLQLHATMLKTQAEKVVAVQKNADDVCASMKKLQEKMERALAVQQNLSKRAAAVLQAVKENQPHLSRAEREFKSELELMAVEVRRMKPRVAEMTVQGQRASFKRYWCSSVLSNDKKKMCYDVLRAETQLIDDTKVLLDDLSANLQQLEE